MENSHVASYKGCCSDNHSNNSSFRREQRKSCCYSNRRDHKGCNCHCHKKEYCREKRFVKECICIDWSVPHNSTQTVYTANRMGGLSASGFISYECGSSAFVTVRFLLGDRPVEEITVYKDSSVAFAVSRFNRIEVLCPPASVPVDPDCPDVCEGELCIKPKYFV